MNSQPLIIINKSTHLDLPLGNLDCENLAITRGKNEPVFEHYDTWLILLVSLKNLQLSWHTQTVSNFDFLLIGFRES
jgi:hypothetical protein